MKLAHLRLGLLCLLPVGLMGCTSKTDISSTETVTGNTATVPSSSSATKAMVLGKSGVQVSLPTNWLTKNKNGNTSCTSADNYISVIFLPVAGDKEIDMAIKTLKDTMHDSDSKNYKEDGPPAPSKVGGLDSSRQTGTVEENGNPVMWIIDTVKAKTPVVIMSLVQTTEPHVAGNKDIGSDDYKAIMTSVKAAS